MSQHPVDPNIAFTDPGGGGGGGWGGKGPDPLEKTQVIWDSIGNKQLDLPLEKYSVPIKGVECQTLRYDKSEFRFKVVVYLSGI